MPSSTSRLASHDPHGRRVTVALWTGLLAGPLLFLTLLEINYVLSYRACELRTTWFLHTTTAAAVVLTLAAGFWGWRVGRSVLEHQAATVESGSTPDPYSRVRWMVTSVVLSTAWFVVANLALDIPVLVLRPCL